MTEEQLVQQINLHNSLYWEKGTPQISDIEYDSLIRQLFEINPKHSLIHKIYTPTISSSNKIKHLKPMLSLDKAYSIEAVIKWAEKHIRTEDELLLIQPKYDGISANYANGVLTTRGDGEFGEDVTDKLPLIELESEGYTGILNRDVRGEIIIRDDDFKTKYNTITRKNGQLYKNSRNAVAGIIGLKTINLMLEQNAKVTLIDYDYISYTVKFANLAEKWDAISAEIETLPYPMDGIVIKLKDTQYKNSLGNTAHHPRGEIAYKFSGVRKTTKLVNVEWSFGKNCLTPVAELEPIELGGVTIKHATLHNLQNIKDKDIYVGDTVTVERAGDVIPYIINSIPGKDRKNIIITLCPSCGNTLQEKGPELCCFNDNCFERVLQRLMASIKSIGIERLGEPNIRKMMKDLSVKNLKDIFDLSFDDIMSLEGYKSKSANNLYGEIQKRRKMSDFQLLASLNINGVGANVAKVILEQYSISELRDLSVEELSEINGIGPERAKAIVQELISQSELLDNLLNSIDLIISKNNQSNQKTICFTGKMPEKRSFYENIANENNYEAVGKVTQNLDILVAVDINGNSSKITKAKKANITVMSLDSWLENISNQDKIDEIENIIEDKSDDLFSDLPLFAD